MEFILQGFTERTHLSALSELLTLPDVNKVILSVAFISEAGVQRIEEGLRPHAGNTVVFAGIRNDITSIQGLRKLYDLGVSLYTVDTGSRMVIFHPKLFFARSTTRAKLLIGSANLTLGGLNNNIEASMALELDLAVDKDAATANDIEDKFTVLQTGYTANITQVAEPTMLDEMLACGKLTDEMEMPPPRPTTSTRRTGASDSTPRIALLPPVLRRLTVRGRPRPPTIPVNATPTMPTPARSSVGVDLELVWESKALTRRDLGVPDAQGTHATGSINLDKGLLEDDVDHRHYFRDNVFPTLTWTPRTETTEETTARFSLVLKGISYGEYELSIRHTTTTNTRSYAQRNAMTRLSWGPMREHVANPDLIGRNLSLYRDKTDPTRFVLEID